MYTFIFITKFFLCTRKWYPPWQMMAAHHQNRLLVDETMRTCCAMNVRLNNAQIVKIQQSVIKKIEFLWYCSPMMMTKWSHQHLFWLTMALSCIYCVALSIFDTILVGCCIAVAQVSPQEPEFGTFCTLDTARHVTFFDQNRCKNRLYNSVRPQSTL